VVRTSGFGNFGRHIFRTFGVEADIIMQCHEVAIGFQATAKCLIVNDMKIPFYAKMFSSLV